MPIPAVRELTSRDRTRRADIRLGALLAFVAGAVNAGGFVAVHRYTSHMTGIVSGMADELAVGRGDLALAGLFLAGSFLVGAMVTSILVNCSRARGWQAEYALALTVEALLLLLFALLGAILEHSLAILVPVTALLLCFIMGVQNAVITKISRAEIRTTHVTGVVTDIGIEAGRLLYWSCNGAASRHARRPDRDRLGVHLIILGMFFTGGVIGAIGFGRFGWAATIPLAAVLLGISLPSLLLDSLLSAGQRTGSRTKKDG